MEQRESPGHGSGCVHSWSQYRLCHASEPFGEDACGARRGEQLKISDRAEAGSEPPLGAAAPGRGGGPGPRLSLARALGTGPCALGGDTGPAREESSGWTEPPSHACPGGRSTRLACGAGPLDWAEEIGRRWRGARLRLPPRSPDWYRERAGDMRWAGTGPGDGRGPVEGAEAIQGGGERKRRSGAEEETDPSFPPLKQLKQWKREPVTRPRPLRALP
ncbi:hypothetical protein NDU88_004209 [Pleurodeles waltl]|uniref:Uncharacterized protein n=1 Tax=Pleurodeles waltl TaxID=8319 RepID=A0AAV7VJK9_PLEWA|nr:hypothetical protein NDU88_004209 [Pleurodeles waltl]